ncbi:MAG: hypothetical protein BHV88_13590 [Clostridiales bacterium 41_12_two_minus]|nr:MAG: hypothetical protein BHV88_13590 [Clostridiales bacterium 41_12_two_minus]
MCGSTLDCFAQRPIWAHFDILGDTCRNTAGGLVGGTVDGDTVPHLIVIGNPPLLPYLPIW